MYEERYAQTLRRAAAAALFTLWAGAAFAGDPDPQKLGCRAVAQNDEATVALLAQRIAAGAGGGDPYLYLSLMAKDYAETAESAPQKNFAGREAFLKAVLQQENARAACLSVQVGEVRVDEHNAACTLQIRTETNEAWKVNLDFVKHAGGWLLAKSDGLSQIRPAAARQKASTKSSALLATPLLPAENEAARTFIARPLSAEHQIDRLSRALTRNRLQRNLFSMPHGSAFFARVEQFNSAPFMAASYVQLVTDPAWNRIVYGDYQKWIKAYEGEDSGLRLQRPHGIAADARGFVYVADTGNRRVLVLKLSGPADQLALSYAGTLNRDGLSQPLEVAWDDRGTIFDGIDDVIWVIDGGAQALLAYSAAGFPGKALLRFETQEFVAPSALALGRFEGRSDGNVYVADAGARRLFRFYFDGQSLIPLDSYAADAEAVPAGLAADHWGNVYLADASHRRLQKFSPHLTLLATLPAEDEAFRPARFQPLFGSVARPGREPQWSGYDQAFLLEQWSENSGARRYELGIDFVMDDLRLSEDLSALALAGKLTDAGHLKMELVEKNSGAPAATLFEGWSNAGAVHLDYNRRDAAGALIAPGYYKLHYTLQSTYGRPQIMRASEAFYVPLYYYEDCGGAPNEDAHLLRGARHATFGTEASRSVAADPQAVIYRYTGLNPQISYEVKAGYYAAFGEVKQALYAGENVLHETALPEAASSATGWLEIPAPAVVDGRLDLRVVKTGGSGQASVAEIWLREAHFNADDPPAPNPGGAAIPQQFTLAQNYPNPFNPTTTISFSLPEGFRGEVTLRIYNMLGEMVRELVRRDLSAGHYREIWDGLDASGRRLATGVFVYQLRAGDFSATKKLVLMK